MSVNKNVYPLAKSQKYCLWMNMPSHHQLDFIKALHESDIDMVVRYYGQVDERRKIMGWDSAPRLGKFSKYFKSSIDTLDESIPDWRERVHVIPGTVGNKFLMALVDRLIREKVNWVHWSEDVKPGWSRIIRLPFRKRYGKKINRYALGALAISKSAETEFISWGIASKKIRWLPYAANPLIESYNVNDKIKKFIQNKFVFMFSGALCQRKATDLLLKSYKRITEHYQNVALIMIGPDTTEQYYKAYAEKSNISKDKILFTGSVAYEQMQSLLPLCDVFILPSRRDGWGMVIYEAASIGKAIIATERCGAAHHIIIDGLNGFRIAADDVDALTNAMIKYVKSPGMTTIHGAHSKIVATFFYPSKNVERFLCAMESFLRM
jgi:glycosyltransferase involved in cell wall biosynthesis